MMNFTWIYFILFDFLRCVHIHTFLFSVIFYVSFTLTIFFAIVHFTSQLFYFLCFSTLCSLSFYSQYFLGYVNTYFIDKDCLWWWHWKASLSSVQSHQSHVRKSFSRYNVLHLLKSVFVCYRSLSIWFLLRKCNLPFK